MATFLRITTRLVALLSLALLTARPALAQSVLRDTETEAFLQDLTAPIVEIGRAHV